MSDRALSMPASDYHALKALSAGMIWEFDSECPLKAWLASPWNPDREPVNARHFDIGTAAHLAVLEPHDLEARTVIVQGVTKKGEPSPGYASAAAKEQRAAAYEAGLTPLLPEEMDIVRGVQAAVIAHPKASELFRDGGIAEGSLTWEWNGMTCKCRPDFITPNYRYLLDLKSANTCNPRAVARKAFNEGWFVRASWYMGGVKEATGTFPDKYLFVVVEKDAPHIVEIFELDDRALIYGDQIIERTLKRIVGCFSEGRWPGYGDGGITKLALPSWAEFQRAEREETGDFDANRDV
jgi:hypothetical protein